ncbi:MAG: DUF371 domain-containing protein [Candidatus Asgardarchaeia archaeon]
MSSPPKNRKHPFLKKPSKTLVFSFKAYGHENIRATHRTTLEITKDEHLTKRGDCIIAVNSTVGLSEFPEEIKNAIRRENSNIVLIIECEGLTDKVVGKGSPKLKLSHPKDIVCRRSNYVCPRTLMINANKSAIDIDRRIIKTMKNSDAEMKITLIVNTY